MTGYEALFLVGYGLFAHNTIHASAHQFASTTIVGCESQRFEPYPGVRNGAFTMDYGISLCDSPRKMRRLKTFGIFPQALNGAIFTATSITSPYIDSPKVKRYVRLAGMFAPLIDATTNYVIRFYPNETYRNRNDYTELNKKQTIIVGAAIAAAWWYALEVF
jgi:hypothetical protein